MSVGDQPRGNSVNRAPMDPYLKGGASSSQKALRFSEGDLTGVAYIELPVRHQLWIGRSRSNR